MSCKSPVGKPPVGKLDITVCLDNHKLVKEQFHGFSVIVQVLCEIFCSELAYSLSSQIESVPFFKYST